MVLENTILYLYVWPDMERSRARHTSLGRDRFGMYCNLDMYTGH